MNACCWDLLEREPRLETFPLELLGGRGPGGGMGPTSCFISAGSLYDAFESGATAPDWEDGVLFELPGRVMVNTSADESDAGASVGLCSMLGGEGLGEWELRVLRALPNPRADSTPAILIGLDERLLYAPPLDATLDRENGREATLDGGRVPVEVEEEGRCERPEVGLELAEVYGAAFEEVEAGRSERAERGGHRKFEDMGRLIWLCGRSTLTDAFTDGTFCK